MMNHLSDKYKEKLVLRGDLYYADLSPVIGSEQGGLRPVLIVQNNTGNRHSHYQQDNQGQTSHPRTGHQRGKRFKMRFHHPS